jgi:hypothetical protein
MRDPSQNVLPAIYLAKGGRLHVLFCICRELIFPDARFATKFRIRPFTTQDSEELFRELNPHE